MAGESTNRFDRAGFVAECEQALLDSAPERAVREALERAVSEPAAVQRELGEPTRSEIQRLYVSPTLTVLNVIWAPGMAIMPHDHHMWAAIGIYSGREDNIFWRRIRDEANGRVEAAGAKALSNGDAVSLGRDIIHSVLNPIPRFTCALHVYGGDFFSRSRSEWDPESLLERPYNVERALRLFEDANARLPAAG